MIRIDILKEIAGICEESEFGAQTGKLKKFCNDDIGLLLKELKVLRREGLITFKAEPGMGSDDYGELIAASNIKITRQGLRFLVRQNSKG